MKNYLVIKLGVLILLYTAQLGAQNLACNYNLKLNDSNGVKEVLYRLEIKGSSSDFFNNDIVKLNLPKESGIPKKTEVLFKRASKYGVVTRLKSLNISALLYEKLIWKIAKKDTLINNIPLKMATTLYQNKKYSALFNPAISIPEGPFIFKGLPGLVYQIKCDSYVLELLDIQNTTPELINVDSKPFKLLSLKRFRKFQAETKLKKAALSAELMKISEIKEFVKPSFSRSDYLFETL